MGIISNLICYIYGNDEISKVERYIKKEFINLDTSISQVKKIEDVSVSDEALLLASLRVLRTSKHRRHAKLTLEISQKNFMSSLLKIFYGCSADVLKNVQEFALCVYILLLVHQFYKNVERYRLDALQDIDKIKAKFAQDNSETILNGITRETENHIAMEYFDCRNKVRNAIMLMLKCSYLNIVRSFELYQKQHDGRLCRNMKAVPGLLWSLKVEVCFGLKAKLKAYLEKNFYCCDNKCYYNIAADEDVENDSANAGAKKINIGDPLQSTGSIVDNKSTVSNAKTMDLSDIEHIKKTTKFVLDMDRLEPLNQCYMWVNTKGTTLNVHPQLLTNSATAREVLNWKGPAIAIRFDTIYKVFEDEEDGESALTFVDDLGYTIVKFYSLHKDARLNTAAVGKILFKYINVTNFNFEHPRPSNLCGNAYYNDMFPTKKIIPQKDISIADSAFDYDTAIPDTAVDCLINGQHSHVFWSHDGLLLNFQRSDWMLYYSCPIAKETLLNGANEIDFDEFNNVKGIHELDRMDEQMGVREYIDAEDRPDLKETVSLFKNNRSANVFRGTAASENAEKLQCSDSGPLSSTTPPGPDKSTATFDSRGNDKNKPLQPYDITPENKTKKDNKFDMKAYTQVGAAKNFSSTAFTQAADAINDAASDCFMEYDDYNYNNTVAQNDSTSLPTNQKKTAVQSEKNKVMETANITKTESGKIPQVETAKNTKLESPKKTKMESPKKTNAETPKKMNEGSMKKLAPPGATGPVNSAEIYTSTLTSEADNTSNFKTSTVTDSNERKTSSSKMTKEFAQSGQKHSRIPQESSSDTDDSDANSTINTDANFTVEKNANSTIHTDANFTINNDANSTVNTDDNFTIKKNSNPIINNDANGSVLLNYNDCRRYSELEYMKAEKSIIDRNIYVLQSESDNDSAVVQTESENDTVSVGEIGNIHVVNEFEEKIYNAENNMIYGLSEPHETKKSFTPQKSYSKKFSPLNNAGMVKRGVDLFEHDFKAENGEYYGDIESLETNFNPFESQQVAAKNSNEYDSPRMIQKIKTDDVSQYLQENNTDPIVAPPRSALVKKMNHFLQNPCHVNPEMDAYGLLNIFKPDNVPESPLTVLPGITGKNCGIRAFFTVDIQKVELVNVKKLQKGPSALDTEVSDKADSIPYEQVYTGATRIYFKDSNKLLLRFISPEVANYFVHNVEDVKKKVLTETMNSKNIMVNGPLPESPVDFLRHNIVDPDKVRYIASCLRYQYHKFGTIFKNIVVTESPIYSLLKYNPNIDRVARFNALLAALLCFFIVSIWPLVPDCSDQSSKGVMCFWYGLPDKKIMTATTLMYSILCLIIIYVVEAILIKYQSALPVKYELSINEMAKMDIYWRFRKLTVVLLTAALAMGLCAYVIVLLVMKTMIHPPKISQWCSLIAFVLIMKLLVLPFASSLLTSASMQMSKKYTLLDIIILGKMKLLHLIEEIPILIYWIKIKRNDPYDMQDELLNARKNNFELVLKNENVPGMNCAPYEAYAEIAYAMDNENKDDEIITEDENLLGTRGPTIIKKGSGTDMEVKKQFKTLLGFKAATQVAGIDEKITVFPHPTSFNIEGSYAKDMTVNTKKNSFAQNFKNYTFQHCKATVMADQNFNTQNFFSHYAQAVGDTILETDAISLSSSLPPIEEPHKIEDTVVTSNIELNGGSKAGTAIIYDSNYINNNTLGQMMGTDPDDDIRSYAQQQKHQAQGKKLTDQEIQDLYDDLDTSVSRRI